MSDFEPFQVTYGGLNDDLVHLAARIATAREHAAFVEMVEERGTAEDYDRWVAIRRVAQAEDRRRRERRQQRNPRRSEMVAEAGHGELYTSEELKAKLGL